MMQLGFHGMSFLSLLVNDGTQCSIESPRSKRTSSSSYSWFLWEKLPTDTTTVILLLKLQKSIQYKCAALTRVGTALNKSSLATRFICCLSQAYYILIFLVLSRSGQYFACFMSTGVQLSGISDIYTSVVSPSTSLQMYLKHFIPVKGSLHACLPFSSC